MGDDILDLPVLARVGLAAAPADAVDEVRARVHWVAQRDGRRRRGARADRADPARAGPWDAVVATYLAGGTRASAHELRTRRCSPALVALLAGLAIGKAWERYKLRDGQWIDRRRARESPHYILGLNFLVANQIDLAIEELSKAASLDADALEVHMILGNLYREKGQVGKAITRAPEPAAAAEPEQARARLRAALPRPRLQARRLRRSRARGVQRGAAARSEERVRAASTCRSCTKNSISGPRRTTRGSGCRSWPTSTRGRRARRFSRSSRTRSASRRCAARTTRRRSGASRRRSISTRAPCRRI